MSYLRKAMRFSIGVAVIAGLAAVGFNVRAQVVSDPATIERNAGMEKRLDQAQPEEFILTMEGDVYQVTNIPSKGYITFQRAHDLPSRDVLSTREIAPWTWDVIYTSDPRYGVIRDQFFHRKSPAP